MAFEQLDEAQVMGRHGRQGPPPAQRLAVPGQRQPGEPVGDELTQTKTHGALGRLAPLHVQPPEDRLEGRLWEILFHARPAPLESAVH